jgi:hypothetical protein
MANYGIFVNVFRIIVGNLQLIYSDYSSFISEE